jgi:hypothetical protein
LPAAWCSQNCNDFIPKPHHHLTSTRNLPSQAHSLRAQHTPHMTSQEPRGSGRLQGRHVTSKRKEERKEKPLEKGCWDRPGARTLQRIQCKEAYCRLATGGNLVFQMRVAERPFCACFMWLKSTRSEVSADWVVGWRAWDFLVRYERGYLCMMVGDRVWSVGAGGLSGCDIYWGS